VEPGHVDLHLSPERPFLLLSASRTKADVKEKPYKIECRGVWKVFGDGASSLNLVDQSELAPTDADLNERGMIAAVRDANFGVSEGETFVIMGLSGSGKSSLVRCLSRLIEPTAGEVFFEGDNLLHSSRQQLMEIRRHKMGMVFQHFALLPHLNVIENVGFPLEIQGLDRAARQARALEVIELVGLKGRENYYPRELSGGQQQRVGIARSLAGEPDIWFLDEPFSALDPLIRREMQDEFIRLQNALRKTIVFITHDFDEAIRLADRIAIMNAGRIIQIGTPEDLVLKPADDYVAEFTRDIPRAKVLSVAALMKAPVSEKYADFPALTPQIRIEEIRADLIHQSAPLAVNNTQGEVVGTLYPRDVLDVLIPSASQVDQPGV